MNLDISNTTFCSGFWYVPDNKKYDISHYKKLLPKTLGFIGPQNLVFFYEDETFKPKYSFFKRERLICSFREVVKLPTYGVSAEYLDACKRQPLLDPKEKGARHYQREYLKSGEDAYRKIFSIWTSKLFLLNEVAQQNPFNTEYVCWIDASVSRFKNERENWDFMSHDFQVKDSTEMLYYQPRWSMYRNERINGNASFMLSPIKKMPLLMTAYEEMMDELKHDNYAHDEETILHEMWKKSPDRFQSI
jgi:hypothetical protein